MDNFIDDFEVAQEKAREAQDRLIREGERRDSLIHRTFRQSEAGRELLEVWKEGILRTDVVRHGESHDPYDIGIEAGFQKFVRNIIKTCEKMDKL